jgi:hypothetical protein
MKVEHKIADKVIVEEIFEKDKVYMIDSKMCRKNGIRDILLSSIAIIKLDEDGRYRHEEGAYKPQATHALLLQSEPVLTEIINANGDYESVEIALVKIVSPIFKRWDAQEFYVKVPGIFNMVFGEIPPESQKAFWEKYVGDYTNNIMDDLWS